MRVRTRATGVVALLTGSLVFTGGYGQLIGQQVSAGAVSTATPPVWSAEFMDGNVVLTRDQAVSQAKAFDVIAATKGMYRSYAADMKAANPNLQLLVYLNGSFAQKDQGSAYPDSWYERDANGNKITSAWGNYLMNPANAGWTQDVVSRCQSFLSFSGYDGCFLDTMGTAPLDPGYASGVPVNPSTGTTWTKSDWLAATTNNAAAVRSALGGAPVYANGIATGAKYFSSDGSTKTLLGGTDGAMVELWVRAPYASPTTFKSESLWKTDVDMLVNAASTGKHLVCITKVWSAATTAQKDSIHRFALATFLLGYTPGLDRFSFRYDHGPVYDNPYWHVPIGTPTADYAKSGGAYQRPFTNGLVLVNPGTSTVVVGLPGGSFTTLTGATVSGTIALPAHTGDVLTVS